MYNNISHVYSLYICILQLLRYVAFHGKIRLFIQGIYLKTKNLYPEKIVSFSAFDKGTE